MEAEIALCSHKPRMPGAPRNEKRLESFLSGLSPANTLIWALASRTLRE